MQDEFNPPKFHAPVFKPRAIDDLIFKSVGKLHVDLTQTERIMVVRQLKEALDRYECEVLNIYSVRRYFYELYNKKLADKKSIASLSGEFNMSIKGYNANVLEPKVTALMRKAFQAEAGSKKDEAIRALRELKPRHTVLYSEEVFGICKDKKATNDNAAAALIQVEWVSKYRNSLCKSIIKMAVDLALKHKRPLVGDVISDADLIQEAVYAIEKYVNLYQPIDDGVTFTSYMYSAIDHHLSHFVNENTRTVALPRTIIDRYRPVRAALDQIGSSNLKRIADLATLNLYELKQQSSGRRLDREEAYTAKEVHDLMTYTQDIIGLQEDNWHTSFGTAGPRSPTIVINVEDPTPNQEEQYDAANNMTQLMEIVHECTNTPEESAVMEIRWGMGEVRGLKTAADIYKNTTGRPMNKGKVAEIERMVMARLRGLIESGDNRLVELKEVVEKLF